MPKQQVSCLGTDQQPSMLLLKASLAPSSSISPIAAPRGNALQACPKSIPLMSRECPLRFPRHRTRSMQAWEHNQSPVE